MQKQKKNWGKENMIIEKGFILAGLRDGKNGDEKKKIMEENRWALVSLKVMYKMEEND